MYVCYIYNYTHHPSCVESEVGPSQSSCLGRLQTDATGVACAQKVLATCNLKVCHLEDC